MNGQKLGKNALKCMYVGAVIEILITTAALLGLRWILKNGIMADIVAPDWVLAAVLGLIPVTAAVSLASPCIRYARYRYRLTEEELEVREGILVVTRELVPIERIHKIELSAGPIDRMFGLAKVTAVTAGGEVTARFLQNDEAEQIADALKKRINHMVRSSKENTHGAE